MILDPNNISRETIAQNKRYMVLIVVVRLKLLKLINKAMEEINKINIIFLFIGSTSITPIHSLNANIAMIERIKPNTIGLKKTNTIIKKPARKIAVIVLLNIIFY